MFNVDGGQQDGGHGQVQGGGRQLAGGGESEQEGLQEEVEDVEFRFHGVAGRLPLEKRGVSGTF